MRRVVVTGIGAVTPLGGDIHSSWKKLILGKSGASSITRFDPEGFPCTIACEVPLGEGLSANDGSFNPNDWVSPKDQKKIDTFILYGIAAAEMAIKDSGWKIDVKNILYKVEELKEFSYINYNDYSVWSLLKNKIVTL